MICFYESLATSLGYALAWKQRRNWYWWYINQLGMWATLEPLNNSFPTKVLVAIVVVLHFVIHFVLHVCNTCCITFYFFFFNVYFWERETHTQCEWGRQREGDTESEAGSRLWAVSTDSSRRGARTHEPWDHDLSWSPMLSQLSHPGTPFIFFIFK